MIGGIFADNNGIIDHQTEHHDKTEHDQQIQGDAREIEHGNAGEEDDRQSPGRGQCHRRTQEQHQQCQHQRQTDHTVVGQYTQAQAGDGGKIVVGADMHAFTVFFGNGVKVAAHLVDQRDDVRIAFFDDNHGDGRIPSCGYITVRALQCFADFGDILQIK